MISSPPGASNPTAAVVVSAERVQLGSAWWAWDPHSSAPSQKQLHASESVCVCVCVNVGQIPESTNKRETCMRSPVWVCWWSDPVQVEVGPPTRVASSFNPSHQL